MTYPYAFLFDKDGVITDNNAYHKTAWHKFLEKYDMQIPEEEFEKKIYGRTNEEILHEIWPKPLSASEAEELSEAKEALFREIYLPDFKLTQGLQAFLDSALHHGISMAVATNAPKSNLDFTLDTGQLRKYFKAAVYAIQVGKPKPAPDVYLKAAELLSYEPSRCIVFEDSLTGIKAARAAGAAVIAITTTYPRAALERVADLVIDSFDELDPSQLDELISL